MNLTQWKLIYIQINCCSANNLLVIPVEQDLICFLKKACARHFLERNWLCVVWFCHFARIVISINFSEENCINVWNSGLILKDGKTHFVFCGLIQFTISLLYVFFCSSCVAGSWNRRFDRCNAWNKDWERCSIISLWVWVVCIKA